MKKLINWIRRKIFKKDIEILQNAVNDMQEANKDLENAVEFAKDTIEDKEPEPIGYQITDYEGNSKVYSNHHVFKTFLNAMDFADNNNFLFGFEVRPVYAKDIKEPIYIDSSLCR